MVTYSTDEDLRSILYPIRPLSGVCFMTGCEKPADRILDSTRDEQTVLACRYCAKRCTLDWFIEPGWEVQG